MTTFSGDCFDDFNKGYNQLVFNYLIVTNEHTIIPPVTNILAPASGTKKLTRKPKGL